MIRHFFQRLLVTLLRLGGAALAILLLIEFSFGVLGGSSLGGSSHHIWESGISDPVPDSLSPGGGATWGGILARSGGNSALVLGIAYGTTLLVGYAWGVLSARFRRIRLGWFLGLPLHLLACVPAFWFVVMVAVYSFFAWERPGFANDVVVEQGPDLVRLWNAAVVALPLAAVAAAWQVRAVSGVIQAEANRPFVAGLYLAGFRREDIFYRNVLGRAGARLLEKLDTTLPVILGGMIVAEWAFHYDGIGSLTVDSIRAGSGLGVFLGVFSMAVIVGAAGLLRECLAWWAERGGKEAGES